MKISSSIEYLATKKGRKTTRIFIMIKIADTIIHITKRVSAVTLKFEPTTISWGSKSNQKLEIAEGFIKGLTKAKHLAEILDKKYI